MTRMKLNQPTGEHFACEKYIKGVKQIMHGKIKKICSCVYSFVCCSLSLYLRQKRDGKALCNMQPQTELPLRPSGIRRCFQVFAKDINMFWQNL